MNLAWGQILALVGAGLSVLGGGLGSAKAVRTAGQAGAGVVSENPDTFGQVLVMQLLPGTQGVYGFLIAFIVLIKTGFLGGMIDLSLTQGLQIFLGCLPITIVGGLSAVYQGQMAAASITMTGRNPELGGRGITMTVMVETYAVLAFLASFLLVWFVAL